MLCRSIGADAAESGRVGCVTHAGNLRATMSNSAMTPHNKEKTSDEDLNWFERLFNHDIEGNVDVDGTPVDKNGSFRWDFSRFWGFAGPGVRCVRFQGDAFVSCDEEVVHASANCMALGARHPTYCS